MNRKTYRCNAPMPFKDWRIDDSSGFLRVTARVLKEGVFDYAAEELGLHGDGIIREYIPAVEFTPEALASLEGKPVVIEEHTWRKTDNNLRDGLTVGNVAGQPWQDAGAVYCDFLISDPQAIEAVTSGNLTEVSAGYDGLFVEEPGEFNGQPYDSVQKELVFNHILLLPSGQGRCGPEVRILNQKKTGGGLMKHTLKMQFGNRAFHATFTNEEDKAEAERMVEEVRQFNAAEIEEAVAAKAELNKEIEAAQAKIEEVQAQVAEKDQMLQEAKAYIEEQLSPAALEALAGEVAEQGGIEGEIVEEEIEDEFGNQNPSDEEFENRKNSVLSTIRKGKSLAERRANTVRYVMERRGKEIPKAWDQNAFDGAFEAMRLNRGNKQPQARRLNGNLDAGGKSRQNSTGDLRERMLRPMKVFNSKDKGGN